jgi:hypothetical protein
MIINYLIFLDMKRFLKISLALLSVALIACMFFYPEALGMSADNGVSIANFLPLFGIPGIENMGGMKARAAFISRFAVTDVPRIPMRATDAIIEANPGLGLVPGDYVYRTVEGSNITYVKAKPEELAIAKGAFVFKKNGDKPVFMYATDKTVSYGAESQGETDGYSKHPTGELFYPGMGAKAAAADRKLNNTSGYLVLETNEGNQIIVGQPGLPCTLHSNFNAGQARADRRGFTFTYEADSFVAYATLETPIDFDALESEEEDIVQP